MHWKYCSLARNHRYVCLYIVWIKREYQLAHFYQFFNWFHVLSILLMDQTELRRTTQPSIMGGPLGDPGFRFFRSTAGGAYPLVGTVSTNPHQHWIATPPSPPTPPHPSPSSTPPPTIRHPHPTHPTSVSSCLEVDDWSVDADENLKVFT